MVDFAEKENIAQNFKLSTITVESEHGKTNTFVCAPSDLWCSSVHPQSSRTSEERRDAGLPIKRTADTQANLIPFGENISFN